MSKIQSLIEAEGYENEVEFAEKAVYDGACHGICMNRGCNYTTEVEPDQSRGWCEVCETNTVQSGLILMGIV